MNPSGRLKTTHEATGVEPAGTPPTSAGLKERLARYERELILLALAQSNGNQRRAAKTLGLLPSTLNEKLKRLGIRRREYPHDLWPPSLKDASSAV